MSLESNISNKYPDAKILIVEDTEFNRVILSEILNANGFKNIIMAENGQEGLEKLKMTSPDLVILDIMMPVMDGYEFCKKVRSEDRFKTLPILVQSAVSAQEEKIKAFEVGATDLVAKPINPKEFIARVNIHLENRFLMNSLEDYKSRVELELTQARQMQKLLMPKKEQIHKAETDYKMDISTYFQTCTEMGGDFWGLQELDEKHLSFYNVDFTGHGVTAALNTFRMHTLVSEKLDVMYDPGTFLNQLNSRLYGLLAIGQFATMFYGVIDFEKEELKYATAASTYPIIYSYNEKKAQHIKLESYPMGIKDNAQYTTTIVPFKSKDKIFLYSDGLTEARNNKGEMLGEDVYREIIEKAANAGGGSNEIMRDVLAKFKEHRIGELEDDLTINIFSRI